MNGNAFNITQIDAPVGVGLGILKKSDPTSEQLHSKNREKKVKIRRCNKSRNGTLLQYKLIFICWYWAFFVVRPWEIVFCRGRSIFSEQQRRNSYLSSSALDGYVMQHSFCILDFFLFLFTDLPRWFINYI